MKRIQSQPRENWRSLAEEYGFNFHTMYGEPYWDESVYYEFTLQQIEKDIEDVTKELHQMCLDVVDRAVNDSEILSQLKIPSHFWQQIYDSWQQKSPSLYSRLDLAYDGTHPAKLLENNADTPTSVYETGFWQWLWLEDMICSGNPYFKNADQFNSLQENLIERFSDVLLFIKQQESAHKTLYFSCCKDTDEDRGTVQYLQDCAEEAGLTCNFIYIEDIGMTEDGLFVDLDNHIIDFCFKLYPWEFMFEDEYGKSIIDSSTQWIEPIWKSILSNKGILPLLWKYHPNHPNLLPAWFEKDIQSNGANKLVKKPFFSREGANISIIENSGIITESEGPYGVEGFVYQEYVALPNFAGNYPVVGSWLVNDKPSGMGIREDANLITQDLSRYVPHIIR